MSNVVGMKVLDYFDDLCEEISSILFTEVSMC
jgi:hypothetical protein